MRRARAREPWHLTFDDLPFAVPGDDQAPGTLPEVQRANARILKILAAHHATAIGFVNEIKLNADHLDAVLSLFERHGYKFVTVDEALRDLSYTTADDYIGPDGLTWLERWQIALGKPIRPNEPKPPKRAQDSYRRITGREP